MPQSLRAKYSALILRSGLLAASRRMATSALGHPSRRRKSAAPQDEGGVLLWPIIAHLRPALGDQARAALAAGVDPQPVDGDGQAVAQADQEVDVGDAPD